MSDIYTNKEMEEALEFIVSKVKDHTKYDDFSRGSINLMCAMVKLDYERLHERYRGDDKTKSQLQTFTRIIKNLVDIHKDENKDLEGKFVNFGKI